jgi:hypothetical protein
MAQLNTRGTLTRSRLDFYEHSNCWGFVLGNVPNGGIYAYLVNNASSSLQLDVYGMKWFSSVAETWEVTVRQPVQGITPITPAWSEIHAIQPDLPMPLGVIGLASNFIPSATYYVMRQSGGATSGELEIGYRTPHIVLPPGWLIVIGATAAAAVELSVTFFFQQVLDNIPPAQ